jgi:hypothetical protein
MKKKTFLLLALFTTMIMSCGEKVISTVHRGSVHLIQEAQDDAIIVVRSLGYANKQAFAQEDAEGRAIRTLMFTGFSVNHPAMLVEKRVKTTHASELNDFFASKAYKSCIQKVVPVGALRKIKGEKFKKMPFDITIDTNALRQLLRQKGIFRMGF